jgi:hypothetical protein
MATSAYKSAIRTRPIKDLGGGTIYLSVTVPATEVWLSRPLMLPVAPDVELAKGAMAEVELANGAMVAVDTVPVVMAVEMPVPVAGLPTRAVVDVGVVVSKAWTVPTTLWTLVAKTVVTGVFSIPVAVPVPASNTVTLPRAVPEMSIDELTKPLRGRNRRTRPWSS